MTLNFSILILLTFMPLLLIVAACFLIFIIFSIKRGVEKENRLIRIIKQNNDMGDFFSAISIIRQTRFSHIIVENSTIRAKALEYFHYQMSRDI